MIVSDKTISFSLRGSQDISFEYTVYISSIKYQLHIKVYIKDINYMIYIDNYVNHIKWWNVYVVYTFAWELKPYRWNVWVEIHFPCNRSNMIFKKFCVWLLHRSSSQKYAILDSILILTGDSLSEVWFGTNIIHRLNSGIFETFELSAWNIYLNSSDCRASKIIKNDTKFEPISWELSSENSLLNLCVGESVGGKSREV